MAKATKRQVRLREKLTRLSEKVEALAHPTQLQPYDLISTRVMAAVTELNGALKEAHECAEMRVFMGATARTAAAPMQFNPQIYRLTHSTMTFVVKTAGDELKATWQAVKDPAFQDAAGRGLDALRKAGQ